MWDGGAYKAQHPPPGRWKVVGLFGNSGAGSNYFNAGQGDLSLAGNDASGMDALAASNASNYNQYNPQRVQALSQQAQYWADLANHGYTDTQKNLILGNTATGGAFDDITGAQNQATLKQQLAGTDTPESGGPSSVAGGAIAQYSAARDFLKQKAAASYGQQALQLPAVANANRAGALSEITNPALAAAYQGYGGAGGLRLSSAGQNFSQGNQERNYDMQSGLFGSQGLGGILSAAGSLYGTNLMANAMKQSGYGGGDNNNGYPTQQNGGY